MQEKNKLIELERKRATIIGSLQKMLPVIAGSYGEIYRKCGKSNCWCRNEKGHLLRRVTWTDENRKARTKAVSEKDKKWIDEAMNNYKNYRRQLKEVISIDGEIYRCLKVLMAEKIRESWKVKP